MKYRVFGETTITRIYVVEAGSEEEAIELAQDNQDDYDDEEMYENWNVEEY